MAASTLILSSRNMNDLFTEEELAQQDREIAELMAAPFYRKKPEPSSPIPTDVMIARIKEHVSKIKSAAPSITLLTAFLRPWRRMTGIGFAIHFRPSLRVVVGFVSNMFHVFRGRSTTA